MSLVSATISLGNLQRTFEVMSSRRRAARSQRILGNSLKRLQLRSISTRLVRKEKFFGSVLRVFFDTSSVRRS